MSGAPNPLILEPITPDTEKEWALELDAFRAANDPAVPEWAREIIRELWKEVVARGPAVTFMQENQIG